MHTPFLALLLAAASHSHQQQQPLPATVQINTVFPRPNTTYPPTTIPSFPLVFALQGASTAWNFGFFIVWRIRLVAGGIVTSGQMTIDNTPIVSSFGDDDVFIYLDNAPAILGFDDRETPNQYAWEWDFGFARNCSGSLSEGGRIAATGSVLFAFDAAAQLDVRTQLEDACPVVGGTVSVVSALDGGTCPQLGGDVAQTTALDPCDVEVPDDVVDEVAGRFAVAAAAGVTQAKNGDGVAPPAPSASSAQRLSRIVASYGKFLVGVIMMIWIW